MLGRLDVVDEFPCRVRDIEHTVIAVRDGVKLAARLWLPHGAEAQPAPAILEYIPYRKRDGTRLRDEPMHRWFAGHGYAAVRVDLRGSGESEGLLLDEYSPQEQDDALDVIAWIAAQPWCDGRVTMMGKSWGGFGALQVAALRPPALVAVIAVCASDDRYADDAHYMGGCLLNENLLWGSMLMALCAQPPAPEHAGDDWLPMWRERLAAIRPFPAIWLSHPLRDDYWRHGSICEDFSAVQVPVFAISGWADGYSNAVLRLLSGLRGPRFGWIGPWGHAYPHEGVPGPAAGFLQRALAFLDRHVRGDANAWPEEHVLEAWLQRSQRPRTTFGDRPGRWITEATWPSANVSMRTIRFTDLAADGGERWHEPNCTLGAAAGAWCAFGLEGEMPGDQAADDAASLTFETAPLDEPLRILGAPRVRLRLRVDRPRALLCARLCEVFPDGASARVSFALLDLTHREGHDRCVAMPVGEHVDVEIALNDTAHVFAPGNRLRIALSTDYWPMVWPSPEPVRLGIDLQHSAIDLPRRVAANDEPVEPPPPQAAPPPPHEDLDPGGVRRRAYVDTASGEHVFEVTLDLEADGSPSRIRFADIDQDTGHGIRETFRIRPVEPLSARAETLHRTVSRSAGREATVELRTRLWADADAFHFAAELTAREGGEVVAERQWAERVLRPALG
jgi:putative CocE/NonD family hydrolase